MGNGGEIFVFDMGKPVRIVDLAERMIRLSGVKGIEIRFTGLRDGEKLYEEVLNEEETSKPTFHPKIKIAQVRAYDYADANLRLPLWLLETVVSKRFVCFCHFVHIFFFLYRCSCVVSSIQDFVS